MPIRIEQQIADYLCTPEVRQIPVIGNRNFTITALAQGEYNLNYVLSSTTDAVQLVFRVNIGTQIDRDDQISYEFRALQLLADSGVTPIPYHVDDSRRFFEQGILIMQYLPGEPLDYTRDLNAAAHLFAMTHQVQVAEKENHLIREDAPLSLIFNECAKLLAVYFESDLADPDIRSYLLDVKAWMDEHRAQERYYQNDPWPCIINTEVNSGNFIVNRQQQTIHLVDWEMPRWGDPSQDLSHFCAPLTTLWKTAFRMTASQKRDFLNTYAAQITDQHLRDTLHERVRLRDPFVYLRGISWSAMGWVAYQTTYTGVRNEDTWATLRRYMQRDFVRSLFDPFIVTHTPVRGKHKGNSMKLTIGEISPDFTLADQNGEQHTLSAYQGQWVLIYFYPRDDTPGCTTEACGLRDAFPEFRKLDMPIFGISTDSVKSHDKFAAKYELPFTLLADEDKAVVNLYGVWGPKKFQGKEYEGTDRMSFLIDPHGKIAKIYDTVKPAEHAEEVLNDVRELSRP